TRGPDGRDRRVEHLTLTKAGLAAYREMVPLAKAFESQLLARLDLSDRSLILAAIAKLEAQF
ncbi:MarR family transcriptional regulator, partial [Mesorhizobium sp. M1C.F.Ca.ET.212.01.1.1]